jgi:hypothetical protein
MADAEVSLKLFVAPRCNKQHHVPHHPRLPVRRLGAADATIIIVLENFARIQLP